MYQDFIKLGLDTKHPNLYVIYASLYDIYAWYDMGYDMGHDFVTMWKSPIDNLMNR